MAFDDHLHAADPLPPMVNRVPRLQPIVDDLLNIVALLMLESDALRIENNGYRIMLDLPVTSEPQGQRREFRSGDLDRGRSMGPSARFENEMVLVIRLES